MIIEVWFVDDEGLDIVIEVQLVIEDENDVKINEIYVVIQVQVLIEFKVFEVKNGFGIFLIVYVCQCSKRFMGEWFFLNL